MVKGPALNKGRQGTGYWKLRLISFIFFDIYFLIYPRGSHVHMHKDPVPGKEHHRLNITLWKGVGGDLRVNDRFTKRVTWFRSDNEWHHVTKVIRGFTLAFSFGIATKEKHVK